MSDDDWDEWEEDDEEVKKVKEPEGIPVPECEYDYGEKTSRGITFAGVGYSKNGKSLMGTQLAWLNQKWWTTSPAKGGKYINIERFPLVKEMITTGLIPEITELQVIDLDGSFDSKSRYGIFGRLTRDLYASKVIKKTTIQVPGRIVKLSDSSFKELAKQEIQLAKLKFDNEIAKAVMDNEENIALLIDPLDELERLVNQMFRITYEENIAPQRPLKSGKTKEFYSSSLDGIPRKFWYVRNSWFEDCLRAKRPYKGFCYDTFKIDYKDPMYNDDPDAPDYKIAMTKRSHYYLDVIMWFDTSNYEAQVINRFEANQDRTKPLDFSKAKIINYTPRKISAFYEILEAIAPSLMGMVEKEDGTYEYDNIYDD